MIKRITRFRLPKKVPFHAVVLTVAGLIVIVFAFVMEARANREDATISAVYTLTVQAEIESLDWIDQELLPISGFSRPGFPLEQVNGIVIHNIGNPGTTATQNRNFFANIEAAGGTPLSSQFIICLDGRIVQCVPVDEVAFASNHRNDDTLSIEVCHPDDTGRFTDESYAATIRLTAWLCKQFGLTSDDVLRHHDVLSTTDCPRYFVSNPDAWERFKSDVQRAIGELG